MVMVRQISVATRRDEPTLPRSVLRIALGLLCVLAFGVGIYTLQPALNPPLSVIEVRGHLARLTPAQVAAAAGVVSGTRFFDVDLAALRSRVDALPWVASASVTRHWPGAVEVTVVERQPIARWGKRSLLDRHGRPFTPDASRLSKAQRQALPQLSGTGDQAADVLAAWDKLAPALNMTPLALAGLGENPRGGFTAVTRSGITLHLGSASPSARLQTIRDSILPALSGKFADVTAIDLRYTNGFAVARRSAKNTHERKT
ncbi:MAG: FtsQ-type POTRA domain-containing protein [Sinobacteraceae bacterium]|nr:FtsQ-type POTRA domain-containing protein [Nevskiaceae bacterium]